jgi:hypothetical protein
VLPGADPTDPFSDPITESNDLKDAGDRLQAIRILMELCQSDLRCLDAHAHLGNFDFDNMPEKSPCLHQILTRYHWVKLTHRSNCACFRAH